MKWNAQARSLIRETIIASGFDYFGLRVVTDPQSSDFGTGTATVPQVGDILPVSYHWDDQHLDLVREGECAPEDLALDGTSAIYVGDFSNATEPDRIAAAVDQLADYLGLGAHVVLIGSNDLSWGADASEAIFEDATVLAVFTTET